MVVEIADVRNEVYRNLEQNGLRDRDVVRKQVDEDLDGRVNSPQITFLDTQFVDFYFLVRLDFVELVENEFQRGHDEMNWWVIFNH